MKRRIMICLGLLLALYVVGGITALWCLERSTRQLESIVESHRIQSLRASLAIAGLSVETDLLAHLAGHEHDVTARARNEERLSEAVQGCGGCHHEPAIRARLDGIRDTLQSYLAVAPAAFAAPDSHAAPEISRTALHLSNGLVRQALDTAEQAEQHLTVRSAQAALSVEAARFVLFGSLMTALVLGGVVAFHLKGRLTNPVEQLLEGIARIGQGDAAHRLAPEGDEEFLILADAFNKAYDDLRRVQGKMLRAEKLAAVGQLAAGVAHEVLNPLASISSIAQRIRRRPKAEDLANQADLIMEAIARASTVLRELLTFSRPMGVEREQPCAMSNLLERATNLVGYDRRARGIAMTYRCQPDLRPVLGDPERLLLVFTNLIINALDAINERAIDGGMLEITAEETEGRIALRFRDNGAGMTQEQMAHAFEPFFTTKEAGAGTGLGLWICYQIVERHNGRIRLDSVSGEGTTVVVELPCAAEPDHARQLEVAR